MSLYGNLVLFQVLSTYLHFHKVHDKNTRFVEEKTKVESKQIVVCVGSDHGDLCGSDSLIE